MADMENFFKFGLIGWPIDFSLSPLIHEEFFRSSNLTGEYAPYPVFPDVFKKSVSELFSSGVTGLNVTYPHKAAAAEMCNELSGDARGLGVINTMKSADRNVTGYNTDIYGFNRYVDDNGLQEPFFIVGSGGAARAVDYILRKKHLQYALYCRNPADWTGFSSAMKLDGLNDALRRTDGGTVVNATTLGWKNDDVFPVDRSLLENKIFADLNYNRSWHWRNGLHSSRITVYTGEVMLVHQAARSFEIWTGIMPGTARVLEMVRKRLEEGL
jgi:shikimate dehydrogenase